MHLAFQMECLNFEPVTEPLRRAIEKNRLPLSFGGAEMSVASVEHLLNIRSSDSEHSLVTFIGNIGYI